MNKKISIILCTYNEVNHIEECINLVSKTLNNVEIIVVDDNSSDGTLKKLEKLKSTFNFKLFIRKDDRGLASAQKKGFNESTGDFVGTIDVNSYDQILHFNNLAEKLNNGYDIAVLSRFVPGGGDERIFIRAFASKGIYLVSKFILGIQFNDFGSGIFLMKRELLKHAEKTLTTYAEWFIEFIYILNKKKFKIIEVPYVQKKDDNLSKSKSFGNIFTFLNLGIIYFLRILITKIRN
jgi:dolichol-phosphate mannosyltransferase